MNKRKLHTPDFTESNIAKLAELFPSCISEAKDENTAELRRSIVFDQLLKGVSDRIAYLYYGPQQHDHLVYTRKLQTPCQAMSLLLSRSYFRRERKQLTSISPKTLLPSKTAFPYLILLAKFKPKNKTQYLIRLPKAM